MSIYKTIIGLTEQYSKFEEGGYSDLLTFNLDKKTIKNGKTILIKEGVISEEEIILRNGVKFTLNEPLIQSDDLRDLGIEDCLKNPYLVVEKLYQNYKYSVPSEHSQFSRQNFYAVKSDELSFKQLLNNMPRIKAQYMLETYIMFASIMKCFLWENDKHFFRIMNDNDLILYKSWVQ